MRKVLLVAYFTPFRRGGSVRVLGLAKTLPKFGWEPIILTAPLDRKAKGFRVIETSDYPGDIFWLVRRVLHWLRFKRDASITDQIKGALGTSSNRTIIDWLLRCFQEVFSFPDTEKNWAKYAVKAAEKLITKEKVEAIISIWPQTAHLVAEELHKKHKIPWISDFPDAWANNHNYPYGSIRQMFDRRLERRIIENSQAVVTIGKSYSNRLDKACKGKLVIISHGYDDETLNQPPAKLTKKLTFTYTGSIYPYKQDPIPVLTAMSELISEKKIDPANIKFKFVGPRLEWVNNAARDLGLRQIVFVHDSVPLKEAIKLQHESQVLLLLCWEDKNEPAVYTSKFYEYLSAKRPMLLTGGFPNEEIKSIVTNLKAGSIAIGVTEIKNRILALYNEYLQNGIVRYNGDGKKTKQYSWTCAAQKFSNILDRVTC